MSRRNGLITGAMILAASSSLVFWGGCASKEAPKTGQENVSVADSLYQHLGGHDGIARISSAWVDRVIADPVLKARFANTDAERFKARMTALLCQATGGPEVYAGKDMKSAHRGMNTSDAEWNAFMDDLKAALDDLKVPGLDAEELLVKLEPMKSAIVGQ